MPASTLPQTRLACLGQFRHCFSEPIHARFVILVTGWVLCTGKHTITGLLRAAGVVGRDEHSGYHRFFSQSRWSTDSVGLVVARLILERLDSSKSVTLSLDDTLARHTGKHIANATMHRDPLLSTWKTPYFHFGHVWVVLAIVVHVERWQKSFSLPVLARLYRSKSLNERMNREHRKKTELAAEMISVLAERFTEYRFTLTADNAYANRAIIQKLPENLHFVGRGRLDAAVYDNPEAHQGKGRPRIRGKRLLSPKERANKRGRWKNLVIKNPSRKTIVLKFQTFTARWYKVGREREFRFVLVRNWPGHKNDDVLFTTNLNLKPAEIIDLYCKRWSIEETFGWTKSRLGLEDPQNRKPAATERTAPMAFWSFSLVVLWYLKWTAKKDSPPIRLAPWYKKKTTPSFSDMLASLRRESWSIWINDRAPEAGFDQKYLAPLLEIASYG